MAVKENLDWDHLSRFAQTKPKEILFFPINRSQGNLVDGVGITCSSTNVERIDDVKGELSEILNWLNKNGFSIFDLYLGTRLEQNDSILDYY